VVYRLARVDWLWTEAADADGKHRVAYFDTTGRRLCRKQAPFVGGVRILIEMENEAMRTLSTAKPCLGRFGPFRETVMIYSWCG